MQENIQYVPNSIMPCTRGTYRRAKLFTEYEPVHPSRRSPSVQFQDCLNQVPRPIKSTRSIHYHSFHPPERQSRHGSSAHPVRPRASTNLGMLCKYRRRRTSSVVLQCGFNQAVFLVVIMATARPDLSLVPVKRRGEVTQGSQQSLVPDVYASYSPTTTPLPSWKCSIELNIVYGADCGRL